MAIPMQHDAGTRRDYVSPCTTSSAKCKRCGARGENGLTWPVGRMQDALCMKSLPCFMKAYAIKRALPMQRSTHLYWYRGLLDTEAVLGVDTATVNK